MSTKLSLQQNTKKNLSRRLLKSHLGKKAERVVKAAGKAGKARKAGKAKAKKARKAGKARKEAVEGVVKGDFYDFNFSIEI